MLGHGIGCLVEHLRLAMLEVDINQPIVRRIAEKLTLGQLVEVELLVIVPHHLMDDRQIGRLGLEDNQPLLVLPTGTTGHLSHELIGAFVATEVGIVQHGIGIENAHHADILEVQTLGNHLCTYQYVGLALFKVGNDLLVGRAGASGVQVHACHLCFGENQLDIVFYAFGTETLVLKLYPSTSRTRTGHLIGASAIVASELVQALVIGQAHIAILALGHPTAGVALYHGCKATTVLEENDLLLPLQRIAHLLHQHGRERSLHTLLSGEFLDVHLLDVRKADILVSFL